MPKFYAESGECRKVSSFETALEAALDLVASNDPDELNAMISVSETGFESDESAIWFDTQALFEEVYQNAPPES